MVTLVAEIAADRVVMHATAFTGKRLVADLAKGVTPKHLIASAKRGGQDLAAEADAEHRNVEGSAASSQISVMLAPG